MVQNGMYSSTIFFFGVLLVDLVVGSTYGNAVYLIFLLRSISHCLGRQFCTLNSVSGRGSVFTAEERLQCIAIVYDDALWNAL
jgi:hypothetical protein